MEPSLKALFYWATMQEPLVAISFVAGIIMVAISTLGEKR